MELLFPNPISSTSRTNTNITAKFPLLSFNIVGVFFRLTHSPFTHMQGYKIQTKAQCMPTNYIAS